MFNDEELNFIKTVLKQLNFRSGQKEQYMMNEQILEKLEKKLVQENVDN